jgi:hypothetical protein
VLPHSQQVGPTCQLLVSSSSRLFARRCLSPIPPYRVHCPCALSCGVWAGGTLHLILHLKSGVCQTLVAAQGWCCSLASLTLAEPSCTRLLTPDPSTT